MKVSVITPFYNGNDGIRAWQDSLSANEDFLKRKNEKNGTSDSLEVILINDSPKITPSIAGVNLGKRNWQILTNQDNIGTHASRLRGLSEAKGDYIIFLDQDDTLREDAVALFLEAADKDAQETKTPVCTKVIISNCIVENRGNERLLVRTDAHREYLWEMKPYLTIGTQVWSPGQCMIPKTLIPDFWKENVLKANGSDDYFLWLLLMAGGIGSVYIDEPLYTHRETGKNYSYDTTKTDESSYEFIGLLRGKNILSEKDLDTLESMLKYHAKFRKSGIFGKALSSLRHPRLFFDEIVYKLKTKTPYHYIDLSSEGAS